MEELTVMGHGIGKEEYYQVKHQYSVIILGKKKTYSSGRLQGVVFVGGLLWHLRI